MLSWLWGSDSPSAAVPVSSSRSSALPSPSPSTPNPAPRPKAISTAPLTPASAPAQLGSQSSLSSDPSTPPAIIREFDPTRSPFQVSATPNQPNNAEQSQSQPLSPSPSPSPSSSDDLQKRFPKPKPKSNLLIRSGPPSAAKQVRFAEPLEQTQQLIKTENIAITTTNATATASASDHSSPVSPVSVSLSTPVKVDMEVQTGSHGDDGAPKFLTPRVIIPSSASNPRSRTSLDAPVAAQNVKVPLLNSQTPVKTAEHQHNNQTNPALPKRSTAYSVAAERIKHAPAPTHSAEPSPVVSPSAASASSDQQPDSQSPSNTAAASELAQTPAAPSTSAAAPPSDVPSLPSVPDSPPVNPSSPPLSRVDHHKQAVADHLRELLRERNCCHWIGLSTDERKDVALLLTREHLVNPQPGDTKTTRTIVEWDVRSYWVSRDVTVYCRKYTEPIHTGETFTTLYTINFDENGRLNQFDEITEQGVKECVIQ